MRVNPCLVLLCLLISPTLFSQEILKVDMKPDKTDTLKNVRDNGCSNLSKVQAIIMRKTPEAEYEVSFADAQENPVSSFIIRQLNESLFYDKISTSLLALCNGTVPGVEDSAKVKTLVNTFKKRSLYQRMLEASLEVNDDDVYAGKLTVRKYVSAYLISFKPDKSGTLMEAPPTKNRLGFVSPEDAFNDAPGKLFTVSAHTTVNDWKEFSDTPGIATMERNINALKNARPVPFTVHHIQIQFQDGFIENIKVRGKMQGDNRLLKFENAYPIPFSTRRDFRKLQEHPILERTFYSKSSSNSRLSIYLGELLDYDQNLELNCKDYSPVNHVWESEIVANETSVTLKKERTSKILELKAFTDLKGIENDNPNGLVQLELNKRLNLWNNRHQLFRSNIGNGGLFNFICLGFSMNKIENNNKRLPLNYIGTQQYDTLSPNTYASTLKLFQHQVFRVGFDLGIATVDIPGLKSVLNLKGGLYFGRTLTVDTLRTKIDSSSFEPLKDNNIIESGVNSLQIYPELSLQIFPDKRYGIIFSQKIINYRIYSRTVKQVLDSSDYTTYINSLNGKRSGINDYQSSRWIGASEIYAFYSPSQYNQLFFRYRYNWALSETKVNFHQIQIGISTYLTHTSKGKKEQQQDNAGSR